MVMYVWTQKAEDDFRRRHPNIREKDVLRRAGEAATYDGKPIGTGEIQRAFQMRGWVVNKARYKKDFNQSAHTANEIIAEKGDKNLWMELYALFKDGHNIVNASKITGMSVKAIQEFIKTRKGAFGAALGRIDFDKNRARITYVPSFMVKKGSV